MRLFAKISICSILVLSIAVLFSGYLLIIDSYKNAIDRETHRAIAEYQYNKFSVQAQLITNAKNGNATVSDSFLREMSADMNGEVAFFSADKVLLFSNLPAEVKPSLPIGAADDTIVHMFQKTKSNVYVTIAGKITQSGASLYLLTTTDIHSVLAQNTSMVDRFKTVYFITIAISMVLVLLLSARLTHPIKKLTKAATGIAHGNYGERLSIRGGDEIEELSQSFNLMIDAVEDKINKLSQNAKQKEDFVASFAHELKTPLTSVIGYADMLYQKNLPPEEVENAAWYILSEGLRLEALSLKLMDLIVLNKQDFILEEIFADDLLKNIMDSLTPLFHERQVMPHLETDSAYVRVEYDLFKTLLLNLIDNSIKSGCKDIWMVGKKADEHYHIRVTDNGRGIPLDELDRITEAFYMVDKSRSRAQRGVGLGLALAAKIADIHGTSLAFHSEETKFTTVEFDLQCKEEVHA